MVEIDPLTALRSAIHSKTPITYIDSDGTPIPLLRSATSIVLSPSISLPKSTPTRYKNSSTSDAKSPSVSPQDFFTLEAVYLAWHLKDAPGAEYMKQMRENGLLVGFVSITERKAVVEWLEGDQLAGERVVPLPGTGTPPGSPQRSGAQPSASTSTGLGGDPTSPSKRRYVPDTKDLEVVKRIRQNEIELKDRNSVLRGNKPNNFSGVRTAFAARMKKLKETKPNAAPAPAVPMADPTLQARKSRMMFPIIIISSSPTALITMHNVKRFLQESTFEPSQEARSRAAAEGNSRPEDMIPIYRRRTNIDSSGKEIEIQSRYFVVDSVEALSKFGQDAWDRVVCVMTTGQAWQFRPYKWKEPKELFHHVKGFYVSWSNDPPNTKIKDWNVTELKIDPIRRHVDKQIVAHFWKTLDTWTQSHKPSLLKS